MFVASAWVPLTVAGGGVATAPALVAPRSAGPERPRDDDLRLYDRVIARLAHGESYYPVIFAEHRRAAYPLRPGFAVRLPTLAWIEAALGPLGEMAAAVVLLISVLAAWWRRLGEEPGGIERRGMAMAWLAVGASLGLNRYYFVLHELWSGMLLALAFGLHRPQLGRWRGAWLAAGAALAIRELALPFAALMAASAAWRRSWRETGAWALLVALFGAGLAAHLARVSAGVLPGDPFGPGWLALRGLGGWLSDIVLSSNLRFLPHWLAGSLVMLMLLGWAGWRSAAGAFGTLLYLGYGLGFMLAGRDDNFYWGAMVAPAMFIGLAFAPMAGRSLLRAALGRGREWLGPA